jgi:hypothetical protein
MNANGGNKPYDNSNVKNKAVDKKTEKILKKIKEKSDDNNFVSITPTSSSSVRSDSQATDTDYFTSSSTSTEASTSEAETHVASRGLFTAFLDFVSRNAVAFSVVLSSLSFSLLNPWTTVTRIVEMFAPVLLVSFFNSKFFFCMIFQILFSKVYQLRNISYSVVIQYILNFAQGIQLYHYLFKTGYGTSSTLGRRMEL